MNTQEIIHRYKDLGYGLKKSGEPFGVSNFLVKKLLVENNIPIRNFHEAIVLTNENSRESKVNDNYFSVQNKDMAYILGILASDGTIRKKGNEIKLTFAEIDTELLEKIKEKMSISTPLKHYEDSKGFKNVTLVFTSKQIKEDLAKYNIVPQKTFSFEFPTQLKKEFWVDFIRGYFDGDGSISTAGPNAIRFQICSATKNVLETIVSFFKEYDIPETNIQVRNNSKALNYYFQYSTTSTKKIFSILYQKDCLCLKRKYDKFLNLV